MSAERKFYARTKVHSHWTRLPEGQVNLI